MYRVGVVPVLEEGSVKGDLVRRYWAHFFGRNFY